SSGAATRLPRAVRKANPLPARSRRMPVCRSLSRAVIPGEAVHRRDAGGALSGPLDHRGESREILPRRSLRSPAAGHPQRIRMPFPTRLLPLLLVVLLAPGGEALAQGRFGVRTAPPSSTPHPVVPGPGGTGHGWTPRGPVVVHPVPPPYVYGWGFGYRGWLWDPWWPEP